MKKLSIICSIVAVLLVVAGVSYAHFKNSPKKKPQALTGKLVQLASVQQGSIPVVAKSIGTLLANQQTVIRPKISGYITGIHFNEGQSVKAGTVLISLDNSRQKQSYLSTRAQAALANITYQRYLKLGQRNITSPQDIDTYRVDYKKAIAAAKSDKSALEDMELRAPFAGDLGAKSIHVGDYASVGSDLVTLTDTNKLKINYMLPARYSPELKVGQAVKVKADFFPGKAFMAKVSYVAPTVDPSTQTIEVHAVYDNTQHLLRPGQSVNIAQTIKKKSRVILIPASALIVDINGNYVYQVKNNKVYATAVKVGEHYRNQVEIMSGLQPSSQLIVKGQFQVKAGDRVRLSGRPAAV